MSDAPQTTPEAFDARALWSTIMALGQATLALRRARDLALMATGNSMAAASVSLLYEAAGGLLREQGAHFRALANADDSETRAFVCAVLEKLNAPVTVPPEEETAP